MLDASREWFEEHPRNESPELTDVEYTDMWIDFMIEIGYVRPREEWGL